MSCFRWTLFAPESALTSFGWSEAASRTIRSSGWLAQVNRIRGKKQPLTAAGLQALRDDYTRTIKPAPALAAETLTLERKLKAEV